MAFLLSLDYELFQDLGGCYRQSNSTQTLEHREYVEGRHTEKVLFLVIYSEIERHIWCIPSSHIDLHLRALSKRRGGAVR